MQTQKAVSQQNTHSGSTRIFPETQDFALCKLYGLNKTLKFQVPGSAYGRVSITAAAHLSQIFTPKRTKDHSIQDIVSLA